MNHRDIFSIFQQRHPLCLTIVGIFGSALTVSGPRGSDSQTCGSGLTPCRTLSYALNLIVFAGASLTLSIDAGVYDGYLAFIIMAVQHSP